MSLVTPLNRVLGLGSAKSGVEHWWVQRVSAVALAGLGLWFAISVASLDDYTYLTMAVWMSRPSTIILLAITVLTASYHSYLGVQVVIEDYIHSNTLKTLSLVLSTFAHVAAAIIGVYSIAMIAFGPVS
jgi:succinate dehydrogenase / fumarate reductase membrane anchor subunit